MHATDEQLMAVGLLIGALAGALAASLIRSARDTTAHGSLPVAPLILTARPPEALARAQAAARAAIHEA
ncbi:MAG TPA: hypothetical protein PKA05_21210 [Roseiflexaceae bacterium]|nr:hypothetical protein [Roseiflexaceae bacterium]HMP42907.1 hypothetical protein [Roseiflexaceae bacterium]